MSIGQNWKDCLPLNWKIHPLPQARQLSVQFSHSCEVFGEGGLPE